MAITSSTQPRLTVGGLAKASGVAPSAVRFYEAHGLIRSERTASNQRRFQTADACRIKVIKVAQRIGLTVAGIRGFLSELPDDPTAEDWRRLTEQLVDEAVTRISFLAATLEEITERDKLCELPPRPRSTIVT